MVVSMANRVLLFISYGFFIAFLSLFFQNLLFFWISVKSIFLKSFLISLIEEGGKLSFSFLLYLYYQRGKNKGFTLLITIFYIATGFSLCEMVISLINGDYINNIQALGRFLLTYPLHLCFSLTIAILFLLLKKNLYKFLGGVLYTLLSHTLFDYSLAIRLFSLSFFVYIYTIVLFIIIFLWYKKYIFY